MILIVLLALLALLLAIDCIRFDITPMPSSSIALQELIRYLPEGSTVYELGSGFGGVSLTLAKRGRVVAFEAAFFPYLISCIRKKWLKRDNLEIRWMSFFDVHLCEAEYIYCYLSPTLMKRLEAKFKDELQVGTHIFSNAFALPNHRAEKKLGGRVYLYNW